VTWQSPHAVFATGRDSFDAIPVIGWLDKAGGVHQVVTAVVSTPMGQVPAKELPGFVAVVEERELDDSNVVRMVADVWRRRGEVA
jgi:hypothetical protein